MSITRVFLILVFLLFPTFLVRFSFEGIPLSVLDVILLLTCLVFALENGKKVWEIRSKWKEFIKDGFNISALLILVGSFLGLLVAPDLFSGLGIVRSWVALPIAIFWILRWEIYVSGSRELVHQLMLCAGFSVLVLSIFGIGELISGSEDTPDLRLASVFENANQIAMLIAPVLVYLVLRFMSFSGRFEKILAGIAIGILGVALLLTQSFGAILAVSGAIFLSIFGMNISAKNKAILVSVLCGLGAVVLVGFSQTAKFDQMLDLEGRSSSSVRLQIWEVAGNLALENPLLGVGPGQFQDAYQSAGERVLGHPLVEYNHPQPHNLILSMHLGAGILGLLGFVILLVTMYRRLDLRNNPGQLAFLGAFLVILIHGLIDTPFWRNDLALLFWLIVAGISLAKNPKGEATK